MTNVIEVFNEEQIPNIDDEIQIDKYLIKILDASSSKIERVLVKNRIEEVSVGDYILSGGELAAMTLLDCVVRLLPGTLGNPKSKDKESFCDDLLEAPQFTKPIDWNGMKVPEILRTGDHQKILEWKNTTAEQITKKNDTSD